MVEEGRKKKKKILSEIQRAHSYESLPSSAFSTFWILYFTYLRLGLASNYCYHFSFNNFTYYTYVHTVISLYFGNTNSLRIRLCLQFYLIFLNYTLWKHLRVQLAFWQKQSITGQIKKINRENSETVSFLSPHPPKKMCLKMCPCRLLDQ